MRWILWSGVALMGTVAAVIAIGAFLPKAHVAAVSRQYSVPPDRLWQAITDVSHFSQWRPGLESAELLPPAEGHIRWRERTRHDAMTFEVMESVPEQRLVTRIADEGLPFGGTWIYEIKPRETGTELSITERGEIYNPLFRFVARFILGYEGTMVKYHESLGQYLTRTGATP